MTSFQTVSIIPCWGKREGKSADILRWQLEWFHSLLIPPSVFHAGGGVSLGYTPNPLHPLKSPSKSSSFFFRGFVCFSKFFSFLKISFVWYGQPLSSTIIEKIFNCMWPSLQLHVLKQQLTWSPSSYMCSTQLTWSPSSYMCSTQLTWSPSSYMCSSNGSHDLPLNDVCVLYWICLISCFVPVWWACLVTTVTIAAASPCSLFTCTDHWGWHPCECVCVCVSGWVVMPLDSQPHGFEFKPSTGKFSCPWTSSSHTSPPSCDGDLEFSGVLIHWPLLVYQLRVQVGLWVPTPISWESWSVLLQAPSRAPGVCLHWLIVPT